MTILKVLPVFCVCTVVAFAAQSKPPVKSKAAPKPAAPTFKDIQPIFTENCTGCHSGERARAGIDLTSYRGVMDGGEDGPIVKKGAPKESLVIEALRGLNGIRKMPPRSNGLPEDKIKKIEAWIIAGAKP